MNNIIESMRQDAIRIFQSGLNAVKPAQAIQKLCRLDGQWLVAGPHRFSLNAYQRIIIIGAGKATAAMAKTMEELLGNRIKKGCIVVKYGHGLDLDHIQTCEAGHPVPDENGMHGAKEILRLASEANDKDLIICLISGGGSALLPLPSIGISLSDKQSVTRLLLECSARIHDINTLRKHLSRIKGGQLARAAAPATLLTLILSDVIGNDLEVIASGPTVPDPSTFEESLHIITRFGLKEKTPPSVIQHLTTGTFTPGLETPCAGDPCFQNCHNLIIADNHIAIQAASAKAKQLGYHPMVLSSMIEGETREVAKVHAAIAREVLLSANPVAPPACLISGGETTVTLHGSGKGGRNQEFALAAAASLDSSEKIVILSAGTDGSDGPTDAAGAISDSSTLTRAMAADMDPYYYLANNNTYVFFKILNDLVITGPTQTNVMDLRIILVRSSKVA